MSPVREASSQTARNAIGDNQREEPRVRDSLDRMGMVGESR
jgi:hypothetical protein